MFRRLAKWIFWGLAINAAIKMLLYLDLNKRVYNHVPGPCRPVSPIVNGAEDLELLADGTVIVSSGLRFINVSELAGIRGQMFMINLAKEGALLATELRIEGSTLDLNTFNPHGLSSFSDKGQVVLYVVNHLEEEDTVERFIFDKEKKLLTHTKTIRDPLFYHLNDLTAVGLDRFFATNDHYFRTPLLSKIETYVMPSVGSIVYYDGQGRVVESWLPWPNGISVDKAKKHLFVAFVGQESVRVYDLNEDNSLTKKVDISLLSMPDNIFADPENGDVYVGCHPVAHEVLAHLRNPKTVTTPSQVLRIHFHESMDRWTMTESYADEGNVLSGSSSVVRYKGRLLIGTIYDKVLSCEVDGIDRL